MKSTIFLTSCALLALPVGTAAAGPCSGEIDSVAKILASKDAGQGPTAGNTANAGQHPPTTAMSQADSSTAASNAAAKSNQPEHPPTAAMTSAATNLPTGSAAKGEATKGDKEHPPTAVMNKATEGSAASPQDVQRQTSGQPTAAQQAQGASGRPGQHDGQTASAALEQARTFDKAGQEAQCMDAVRHARQLAGS
jgi:hypothetical protein